MSTIHREEQAEREAGQTKFSRGVPVFLVAFFLLAITSIPIIDAIRDPSSVAGVTQLLPSRFEATEVIGQNGLSAGAADLNRRLRENLVQWENDLEKASILRPLILPPLNRFLSGTLGASNAKVWQGRGGWMFYAPALTHLTGPGFLNAFPAAEDPASALANFGGQLAARGIRLVVVPVPVKASIYPERLSSRFDGAMPLHNPSFAPFMDALRGHGVLACDLSDALMAAKAGGEVYLARDTHWSPHGLGAAAQSLAQYLRDNVSGLPAPAAGFFGGPAQSVENTGDLADLLASDSENWFGTERAEIQPVLAPGGTAWHSDAASPVLLLGDSYANIYQLDSMGWGTGAGLPAQLSAALQLPVDAIVQNGDGAHATRLALIQALRRGEDRLKDKQVVVFVFSARELSLGDWKASLQLPEVAEPARPREDAAEPFTISATLGQQTVPPAPGSVPYRDCIISAQLTGVSGAPGLPESVIVYRWGMRDNRWTPAARQRPGDPVQLIVQPWAAVAERFDQYNRIDLDDGTLPSTPVYWEVENNENTPGGASDPPPDTGQSPTRTSRLSLRIQTMEANGQMAYRGRDDWLYFLPEFRFLSAGAFWGESAATVSRAQNAQYADPLPAIIDFQHQLQSRNISLYLLPVPAKASVYPDETGLDDVGGRPAALAEFYDRLAAEGIQIVDLHRPFLEARDDEPFLYCRQDTHWSPYAITLAARRLAEAFQALPWYREVAKHEFPVSRDTLTLSGDLAAMLPEPPVESESLPVWRVSGETPTVDRGSPLLLIGDSHNLVFHAGGDMHTTGAGLPDHLAAILGIPVDVVATRGSGATTPRINLARRNDQLEGKRAVIWCFSVREFTESLTGWRPIPIVQ